VVILEEPRLHGFGKVGDGLGELGGLGGLVLYSCAEERSRCSTELSSQALLIMNLHLEEPHVDELHLEAKIMPSFYSSKKTFQDIQDTLANIHAIKM
jgi:hypothetical protein